MVRHKILCFPSFHSFTSRSLQNIEWWSGGSCGCTLAISSLDPIIFSPLDWRTYTLRAFLQLTLFSFQGMSPCMEDWRPVSYQASVRSPRTATRSMLHWLLCLILQLSNIVSPCENGGFLVNRRQCHFRLRVLRNSQIFSHANLHIRIPTRWLIIFVQRFLSSLLTRSAITCSSDVFVKTWGYLNPLDLATIMCGTLRPS